MHVVAIRKEKEQSFDSDALAIGKERPESVRAQIGKPVHQHVETDGGGSFTLHPMCPLDDLVGLDACAASTSCSGRAVGVVPSAITGSILHRA